MKLHFLGVANEVGASCTLLEIEGQRVLIDSGIRTGAAQGSHLPNFSVLDDLGRPDEVLITHALTIRERSRFWRVHSAPDKTSLYGRNKGDYSSSAV